MASNVSRHLFFDSAQDWKGMREKAEEVNNTKAYVTNDETSR
jgi:hypothetical protein